MRISHISHFILNALRYFAFDQSHRCSLIFFSRSSTIFQSSSSPMLLGRRATLSRVNIVSCKVENAQVNVEKMLKEKIAIDKRTTDDVERADEFGNIIIIVRWCSTVLLSLPFYESNQHSTHHNKSLQNSTLNASHSHSSHKLSVTFECLRTGDNLCASFYVFFFLLHFIFSRMIEEKLTTAMITKLLNLETFHRRQNEKDLIMASLCWWGYTRWKRE